MSGRQQEQHQPEIFTLSWRALLSLPKRLCQPPSPTIGKVRSCGVTPIFKVQLEDVLDRKHLPPLGLKDFEEWLLYVEQCPQNLYFILWLREYTERYNQWAASSKKRRRASSVGEYRYSSPPQFNPFLGMFYARAKQTFFTPNSEYELDVPSDILSPFHTITTTTTIPPSHPDPAAFAQVASEVTHMLKESLHRFVLASYTNVGTNRAWCGIIAGLAIAFFGTLMPVVYTLVHGQSRWLRLCALPGLWFGLATMLSSFHGICVLVFVFGDLRQLRKFELARPPISPPKSLRPQERTRHRRYRRSPSIPPSPTPPPHITPTLSPTAPLTRPPLIRIPPSSQILVRQLHPCETSSVSSSSSSEGGLGRWTDVDGPNALANCVHISPAYHDEHPAPEGPATSPHSALFFSIFSGADSSRRASATESGVGETTTSPGAAAGDGEEEGEEDKFGGTASFIHPYCEPDGVVLDEECGAGRGAEKRPEEEREPISPFDFDLLPGRPSPRRFSSRAAVPPPGESGRSKWLSSPRAMLSSAQHKCAGVLYPSDTSLPRLSEKGEGEGVRRDEDAEERMRARFRLVMRVPMFGPVTRVLSPIVSRAQWEIVVRSCGCALLMSLVVVGCVLA